MRHLRRQPGFTLIEVVIVLALTAAMVAVFVSSQGGINRSTGFSTGLDQLKAQLTAVQNEAITSTQNQNRVGAGGSDLVVFGKMVEFDPATPTTMRVATILGDAEHLQDYALMRCTDRTEQLRNGLTYTGATKMAIMFRRQPNQAFTMPAGGGSFFTAPVGYGYLDPYAACANGTHTILLNPTTPVHNGPTALPSDPRNYQFDTRLGPTSYTNQLDYPFGFQDANNTGLIRINPTTNSITTVVN